jgi:hypothetical protein
MLAALLIEPRLAFFSLCALLLGTAVPLVFAWVRLLPEEAPPFQIERPKPAEQALPRGFQKKIYFEFAHVPQKKPWRIDPFSVFLLSCLTLSFAVHFPGLPPNLSFNVLPSVLPEDAMGWVKFCAIVFLAVVPGVAILYSALRPTLVRVPTIVASAVLLVLWFLSGFLHASLVAGHG